MKRSFPWKLFGLMASLLLLSVLFQWLFIFYYKKSFPLSSLLSLTGALMLTYLLLRLFSGPIGDSFSNTALRRADQKLKSVVQEISQEKDYLQTILKGMTEGVLVVDGKSRIRMVNEALRKLFPLPTDVLNRTLLEVIRNAELEEAIRQAVRDGKMSAFELTLPSSPEKSFEVNVVTIPSSPINGKGERSFEGAIAVFHDISRLKELEKIRQDFVANVSHELRTPLTTIKGYAETLLEGALNEKVAPQFVQVIKRHSDRLTKIVEDLLMLSKIETRDFHLNLKSLSFKDVLDDVLELIHESAEKKGITILKKDFPDSLVVKADRNYLEQILNNLLDNAIKYNREGGEILISATVKQLNEVEISIQDSGIGIPREDLPRVFERFYRVDKGRSKEVGGTGLGLSIVKHLVLAHGGRVWAESQLGEGSTFYFTLPVG